MIVYKYQNQEGSKASIKNNCVLLKCPLDYNDPFDGLYIVSEKERENAYKLFLNYQIFKDLYDQFVLKKRKPNRFKFYGRLLTKEIQLIAKEVKETSYYSTQKSIAKYNKFATKILGKTYKDIRSDFNKMVDDLIDTFRGKALVSCFAQTNKSLLLWSHYGQSHKGACFEFEVDEREFRKIQYSEEIPVLQLSKAMSIYFGNEFNGKKVDTKDESLMFVLEPLLTKSSDWLYENEVRCIFSIDQADGRIVKDPSGRLLLKMPPIRRVYIGCRADKDFKDEIMEEAQKKNIPVTVFKQSKERYEILEEVE